MPNQYVNKVVQSNGTVIIDISDTTAIPEDVSIGAYFYLSTGEKVPGTKPLVSDGDELEYGGQTPGIVGSAAVGVSVAHEYDADIFWDYENHTGQINYGTYEGLARIINNGETPDINVTMKYSENDSYTGLALGISIDEYNEMKILFYGGPTWNDIYSWSTNDELMFFYPND